MSDAVHLSMGWVRASAQAAQGPGLDWLSATEQARLARILAAGRREEFIAGRWFARQLLANVYGGEPVAWSLSAPDSGPPAVLAPAPGQAPHLSLSHSGDRLVCAVAGSPLGVDLEVPRRPRDFLALADAVCSPAERERLRAAAPESREALFHECWTLKEAWLKSRGEGMSPRRMALLDTSAAPGGSVAQGRVWRGARFTVALVARPELAVHWIGEAPDAAGWWAIDDPAAGAGSGSA